MPHTFICVPHNNVKQQRRSRPTNVMCVPLRHFKFFLKATFCKLLTYFPTRTKRTDTNNNNSFVTLRRTMCLECLELWYYFSLFLILTNSNRRHNSAVKSRGEKLRENSGGLDLKSAFCAFSMWRNKSIYWLWSRQKTYFIKVSGNPLKLFS